MHAIELTALQPEWTRAIKELVAQITRNVEALAKVLTEEGFGKQARAFTEAKSARRLNRACTATYLAIAGGTEGTKYEKLVHCVRAVSEWATRLGELERSTMSMPRVRREKEATESARSCTLEAMKVEEREPEHADNGCRGAASP